jgi:hypothetical protein
LSLPPWPGHGRDDVNHGVRRDVLAGVWRMSSNCGIG